MKTAIATNGIVATSIVPPSQLDPRERVAMLELMHAYYENVRDDVFAQDLQSKDWVICLRCQKSGQLVGFSTQRLLQETINDQSVRVLFSGDTIVACEFWNSPQLAQAWGRFALQLIDEASDRSLYWLLLSKGFRTYRFLPLFFQHYAPQLGQAFPAELEQVRDVLVQHLYGDAFDPVSGLVCGADINNYRLRKGVADVTGGRCRDPHIQYFLARNPGHAQGDELCCIAPLARDNFTRSARRVIGHQYFCLL